MKPAIQLRARQRLALTPQLQQAIRLLQFSQLELAAELRELTEANPMLEFAEDALSVDSPDSATSGQDGDDEPDSPWESDPGPPDADLDFSGALEATPKPPNADFEPQQSTAEGLREHLLWQLNLSPLNARDRLIGEILIEALDDNGYLNESSQSLLQALPPGLSADDAALEVVRRQVQQFDPVGAASTSLADCLDVQLRQLADDTPHLALARRIVAGELDLLARNDLERLCQRLHAEPEAVAGACALIRNLDPHPGAALNPAPVEYIVPDAYVRRDTDNRWQVSLSPTCQPCLELNRQYCGLINEVRREDAVWLRGQLQEARWLLKSLESRAETILKVARAIVHRQRAFLESGPEAMRPLMLREVAEEIGMHESTVSRVSSRKYLHTPRGTFEFRYFFSRAVTSSDGGTSATAIQAMLRQLIGQEDPRKPLSDQALVRALEQRGIQVARRTVAKYRETLRIPGSSARRRA